MLLEDLKKYYRGFYLSEPVGNNAFNYEERTCREIYIPPLANGGIDHLAVSENIAFCEVVDGREIAVQGLDKFIYLNKKGKHIFVMDNHNHAFFFWMVCLSKNIVGKENLLVHIDQHKDMREPQQMFDYSRDQFTLKQAFDYTNNILNVGNFIQPALSLGLLNDVLQLNHEEAFKTDVKRDFILDIDIDIFADEMAYFSDELKMNKIKELLSQAEVISIATSPYFIEQNKAIALVKEIVNF